MQLTGTAVNSLAGLAGTMCRLIDTGHCPVFLKG